MPTRPKNDLAAERVRELLTYDPETGVLRWRMNRGGTARAGSVAGSNDKDGYKALGIARRNYKAHRIAWLLHFGRWPDGEIDHIDGNRANNAIANLRDVSRTQNMHNQGKAHRHSKTGVIGVFPEREKYRAQIRIKGRPRYLGTFDTIAEAAAVYRQAKRVMHPFSNPTTQRRTAP